MNIRTVITKSFQKEMLEYFGCEPTFDDDRGNRGVVYRFCVEHSPQAEADFYGRLTNVMKKAVLSSNSILKNSERLTNIIDRIVFGGRGNTEKIETGVLEYFNEYDNINLDGYVYFALNEYSEKINNILYHVVKTGLKAEVSN